MNLSHLKWAWVISSFENSDSSSHDSLQLYNLRLILFLQMLPPHHDPLSLHGPHPIHRSLVFLSYQLPPRRNKRWDATLCLISRRIYAARHIPYAEMPVRVVTKSWNGCIFPENALLPILLHLRKISWNQEIPEDWHLWVQLKVAPWWPTWQGLHAVALLCAPHYRVPSEK